MQLGESRVVDQRVVERVDRREHVQLEAFERFDGARNIARIRNQN